MKSKPAPRILVIVWAGPHPLGKIADLKPERYGITLAPGGNILPVLKTWKSYAGTEGSIFYYYGFPKNPMNDWLVAEHTKRYKTPPDMFTAGGFAAASAVVTALKKVPSAETEKLIAAMEGMDFDTPKGRMTFRQEDHQAMQSMYHFRIKKEQKGEWDLLELVREIPASELPRSDPQQALNAASSKAMSALPVTHPVLSTHGLTVRFGGHVAVNAVIGGLPARDADRDRRPERGGQDHVLQPHFRAAARRARVRFTCSARTSRDWALRSARNAASGAPSSSRISFPT